MFISKLHLSSSNFFFFCILILFLQNYLILLFSFQHSFLCERYPTPSRSSTCVQYITFRFYLSGLPDLMRTVVLNLFRRFKNESCTDSYSFWCFLILREQLGLTLADDLLKNGWLYRVMVYNSLQMDCS
jgi:hypothetical protein